MLTPPELCSGDKVAVVAPAKRVREEEMHTAIEVLRNWGLEVVLGEHLYSVHNSFAGTDAERAADLQLALDMPDIKAIICARGGYGTTRIVDKLDFRQFLQHPKWIVGFSDITVLHCHLYNLGVESIHGVMPLLFAKQTPQTLDSLRRGLFGEPVQIECDWHPYNRLGAARGELVGGNLTLFANAIGTRSDIDTTNKILFLEDVGEYLYHIDRMMVQLYRAGKLQNLAGLLVGQFTEIKDADIPFGKTAYEIIAEIVREFDYPVCFDFPIGHDSQNMSIICGRRATLGVGTLDTLLDF